MVAGGGEVLVAQPSALQAGLITEARVRDSEEENARLDKALRVADRRKHEQAIRDAMSETEAGVLWPVHKAVDTAKRWFGRNTDDTHS